jgi:hypothetical protein
VAWSGSGDEYASFVDRYELTFPQIDDSSADVFSRFGLRSQPAIALVLPDGEVQTLMGAADEELLDSIISSSI